MKLFPSGQVPRKQRKASEPVPSGVPVDNWVSTFGDWWNANIGSVAYPQVGKQLKPAHATFGLPRLLEAAKIYNDPLEGPQRKSFPDFAGTCAKWVTLSEMPMFNPDGSETERTKRLPNAIPKEPRWNGAR